MKHYSVLKKEVLDGLNIKPDGIYVDATLGYAGDSAEILKKLEKGFLYAFDADSDAIDYSKQKLSKISDNYEIIHSNFKNLKEELLKRGIDYIDGIIFDLGLSSPQIDEKTRGFSFMQNAPLDMRMDKFQNFDAQDLINKYSFEDLKKIFYVYGEEARSKIIAQKICEEREKKKIKTTEELVNIIKMAVGEKYFNLKHPERRIFQAIRIRVNNELDSLEKALPDAIELLNKDGRICVISFHSLEDKIVKRVFKSYSEVDEHLKGEPNIPDAYKPLLKIINKKVIVPSLEELEENSRSKSAKLRIGEKL